MRVVALLLLTMFLGCKAGPTPAHPPRGPESPPPGSPAPPVPPAPQPGT